MTKGDPLSDRPEPQTDGAASPGDDPWEQDLLRRFRGGDTGAFGALLRHYQPRVFSLVCRLVGRRDEAEEVMQDAFLQAFKAIGRFPEVRPFRRWLFRVAVNVCRNHQRAALRRESPSELHDAAEPMWQHAGADPEQDALSAEEVQRLEAALEQLPGDDRVLFLLRCKEGMAYEEISQVLDVRAGALRVRYHRVVQRLRSLLYGELQ